MSDHVASLAELIVTLGANVQPGQIVALHSEPTKEPLTRAVAEAAYRRGAKFVDLEVFDVHLKRARALYADPQTLDFVPPWYGERVLALGAEAAASIALTGPVAPRIMDGIDPELVGRDMLPHVKESMQLLNDASVNWTVAPCPTPDWAGLVHPDLPADEALERLWEEIGHVCRLDEPDPIAAWRARMDQLRGVSERLNRLELGSLRFTGPGTDLTVGLLPSSRWVSVAGQKTAGGIEHAPNLPSEEVFTTPDPERTHGHIRSTKPLFVSGNLIKGLEVRFEHGRAVGIEADSGAGTLRALADRDAGAARLGEVSLVDRAGRIGPLGTVFYDTLLDENAASHIALGHGLVMALEDPAGMNESEIHVDFMIGGDEVQVTGTRRDGTEVPLLRGGDWQI